MDLLAVSNVALWIAVVVLLIVNLALARQVGVLYERIAPAGALMLNKRLRVGDPAPDLAVTSIDGQRLEIGRASAKGRSQLLFFVSPDCPVCSSLIPVLRSSARAEAGWLDVIVASDGATAEVHQRYIDARKIGHLPYVVSELLGQHYGVSKLPYATLIDELGRIASMGIVNSREHLESLFEAKERQVASMQDYLERKSNDTAEAG